MRGVPQGGESSAGHPSIAIVSTHFGRAPVWLPAFMQSCRQNPDITWLIYTDIHVDGPVPPNVHIKPTQLEEFNTRCSDTLGVRVNVQSTFLKKLSDLKPAYGLVFADELRSFDFWAYSELDVIWGDIRHFMTDGLLADHDLLSAAHYKLCGHFTLWRNIERMNRMFEIVPDALQIMADPRHFRLDERPFTRQLLLDAENASASYPRIYWEPLLTMSAEYQRALPNGPGGNLWWCRGKTYDAECHELMYLHFHKLKKHMSAINFGYEDSPSSFMINRNGVHCRRGTTLHRDSTALEPARSRAV